jgi:hypothetical protein
MWAALSAWTKDIEGGNRTLSWEIIALSTSKAKISQSLESSSFPNKLPS